MSELNDIALAELPTTVEQVDSDRKTVKKALLKAGVPAKLISGIETRALRSGRRQTGQFKSNRDSRWTLKPNDPQYGTELDCKIILLRLLGMLLQFDDAPEIDDATRKILEEKYLGSSIVPGIYRDSLLLERLSFPGFLAETLTPVHGSSNFHIGHQDPTVAAKHLPGNIAWRTHRSNLIQGNLTLRQARIYLIKLIGRYFELGELNVT